MKVTSHSWAAPLAVAGIALSLGIWGTAPASAGTGTGWHVQRVPPSGGYDYQLTSVSCPSSGNCFAVGGYSTVKQGPTQPLAEYWNGRRWTAQAFPSPSSQEQLTSVSCASATLCFAFGNSNTTEGPLADQWNGSTWTIQSVPAPAGAKSPEITAGSCASTTSCTFTGLYTTAGNVRPLVEHWDGTTWTIQSVPKPAGSTGGNLDGGVSCPTATRCIAVGGYGLPGEAGSQPYAASWNGIRWTDQVVPDATEDASLDAVSCSGPASCTAVGEYYVGSVETALVEHWNGTTWAIQPDAAPADAYLTAVSCTSATSCTAVGSGLPEDGVAEQWNGTSWTLQATPPAPRGYAELRGLACRTAATCTAVGYQANTRAGSGLLAEHE
jgi:hypothetical protein